MGCLSTQDRAIMTLLEPVYAGATPHPTMLARYAGSLASRATNITRLCGNGAAIRLDRLILLAARDARAPQTCESCGGHLTLLTLFYGVDGEPRALRGCEACQVTHVAAWEGSVSV